MSAHYKWYPSEAEVIVPWNARYSFPSQANKAVKMTPRIPPKNGGTFSPGQVIRLEFPAQGNSSVLIKVMSIQTTLLFLLMSLWFMETLLMLMSTHKCVSKTM